MIVMVREKLWLLKHGSRALPSSRKCCEEVDNVLVVLAMAKTLVATAFLAAVPLSPCGLLAHRVSGLVHDADLAPDGVGILRSMHARMVVMQP